MERVLFYAATALIFSGIYALIASRLGPTFDQWLRARHARRLAARLARGSDRYFEELRELESRTPVPYVAHGFAWHFVRTFAVMFLVASLPELFKILFPFSPE
ncbi:hypothetical protein BXU08_15900 [Sphingomonas sp. LM7]|nr:hypothetical protein BXU08_15900 [Sphingomonas sp. LM7]